jgi:cardiolipin synthase
VLDPHPVAWSSALLLLADFILRVGLCLRVIMRRLPVGTSLAWLAIILSFPLVGAALYLFVGEYRLGRSEARRRAAFERPRPRPLIPAAPAFEPEPTSVVRLAGSVLGAAVLPGNHLELLGNADAAFPALKADIDRARRVCLLEFYIWSPGGRADEVGAAVLRAAGRGVACRVLVDAIGSADFLRSRLAEDMRKAGVEIQAALAVGLFRLLIARPDLRLHRKIVVIDDIGYTGSLNLADPLLFKRDAGVGQWVDAFVRIEGPVVTALEATFQEDWAAESMEGDPAQAVPDAPPLPDAGQAPVQVLPSGPDARVEAIGQVVLMAVYAATKELVLTTPYFIPSESLLTALLSAAARGVQVTLVVPAKVDSRLVHYASRAHQTSLLKAGARIALYRGGLLHTKSITVDGCFSLFGSLNLDPRSFRLDFELSLAIYDADFTRALRALQQRYVEDSDMLDQRTCLARSRTERLVEDAARLLSPLL